MPKVLLIDDDAALTGMLTEFLRGEGFETAAAFNGTEGAVAALDPTLDAVILDVMMPDISGIETLQRIRSTSSVPVIMLTAKGAEDDRVAGLEVGADDYISKLIMRGSFWPGSRRFCGVSGVTAAAIFPGGKLRLTRPSGK